MQTDRLLAYDPRFRREVDCEHCGEAIFEGDAVCPVWPLEASRAAGLRWAHTACTKQGVERWLRTDASYASPLLWDRAERPAWTDAERDVCIVGTGPYLYTADERSSAARL